MQLGDLERGGIPVWPPTVWAGVGDRFPTGPNGTLTGVRVRQREQDVVVTMTTPDGLSCLSVVRWDGPPEPERVAQALGARLHVPILQLSQIEL